LIVEIERKFLILHDDWRRGVTAVRRIRQGYVAEGPTLTARVRETDGEGRLTLKSRVAGLRRLEFNFALAVEDARRLLDEHRAEGLVEKTRHRVLWDEDAWDIDVFEGANEGLVVAEIEFADEAAAAAFRPPSWAGREVTGEERYYNASLARRPYRLWSVDERC
jgi:adenylate cyclase